MFTNEQLQAMIRREIISDQYPYSENDDDVLLNYLKPLLAELSRAKIRYTMESNHFGSGYASYIQLLCYTDDFVTVTQNGRFQIEKRQGLHVLISRLAPVIAICDGWEMIEFDETGAENSRGETMVDHPNELHITQHLESLRNDLIRLFMKYHFTIVQKEDVDKPLPFDAHIPTLSRSRGQYLVWDAVFYWED